ERNVDPKSGLPRALLDPAPSSTQLAPNPPILYGLAPHRWGSPRKARRRPRMDGANPAAQTSPGRPIFVDANPLADRHLTGIGRYTARVALALARHRPIRVFSQDEELLLPADLGWDQDQDLARWGRRVWRSRRVPLGTPPDDAVALFGCLRPLERRFS